jgi:hypothetical protein
LFFQLIVHRFAFCGESGRVLCLFEGHVAAESGGFAFECGLEGEVLALFGVGFASCCGEVASFLAGVTDPFADDSEGDDGERGDDDGDSGHGAGRMTADEPVSAER